MRPSPWLALMALTPRLALAAPTVLLFPALGQGERVVVSGRVQAEAASQGSSALSRNLRRLTAPEWEGAEVTVAFDGAVQTATSGEGGAFEVTFSAPPSKPFAPGLYDAQARVAGGAGAAKVEVVSPKAPFFVVSDLDDTLAVTNVNDPKSLFSAALLEDSRTQPVVPGMAAFYRCLRNDKAAPPGFALVSGSPVQYVSRVASFLSVNGFPFFGLYLRDLGVGTLRNYKQPVIRKLIGSLPGRVVLVGDSGEHDPEVYAEIRREQPERVLRVYIHDVGHSNVPARFDGMVLFKDARTAADDAVAQGLASSSCRDQAFPAQEGSP